MAFTVSNTANDAAVNAIVDLIDGGANAGTLEFRDASQLICSITLNDPAFGSASGGTGAALDTTPAVSGTVTPASATIDRFRMLDSNSVVIIDGAAGSVATSGADINLSSVAVSQNDVIEQTSLTVTLS